MKYFFRVVIVLLITVGIIFVFSNHYRENKNKENVVLTTQNLSTTQSTTKKEKKLIAENEEGNYQLYVEGENVILSHDGFEKNFDSWYSAINQELPELYYNDYDGDGEKELLVKLIDGVSNSQQEKNTYLLYLIEPVENDNGEQDFNVISANKNTWKSPFENAIKCEMSQLKSCKKFLQFVMDDSDVSLTYDEKTGISNNDYVAYARALKSGNEYKTLSRWNKGDGFYSVDDNGDITLDVQVLVYYDDEKEPQYAGNIHMSIGIVNGKFGILPKTISFIASDEYKVADPRETAQSNWNSIINNESPAPAVSDNDMTINWIDTQFELATDFTETTISFQDRNTQIKRVDKVELSQSSVKLTAKDGFTFTDRVIENGDYSVVINSGTDDECDIAYSGEIKNVDGKDVLIITFDKTYDRDTLKGVEIKFGA